MDLSRSAESLQRRRKLIFYDWENSSRVENLRR
jgi:hypothetical protein